MLGNWIRLMPVQNKACKTLIWFFTGKGDKEVEHAPGRALYLTHSCQVWKLLKIPEGSWNWTLILSDDPTHRIWVVWSRSWCWTCSHSACGQSIQGEIWKEQTSFNVCGHVKKKTLIRRSDIVLNFYFYFPITRSVFSHLICSTTQDSVCSSGRSVCCHVRCLEESKWTAAEAA